MRALQRLVQGLQQAYRTADAGGASSPSGVRHLATSLQQLVRSEGSHQAVATRTWLQRAPSLWAWLEAREGSSQQHGDQRSRLRSTLWDRCQQQQTRGLFAARKPAQCSPQNHTHDKYKRKNPQPTYEWALGRFVLDRNNVVWHKQANYRHHRYAKTASRLTRLKRWKPLYGAYARKLIKLGFRRRYWEEPDPQQVPGFFDPQTFKPQRRRNADADMRHDYGDPALRQSFKPPPRKQMRFRTTKP